MTETKEVKKETLSTADVLAILSDDDKMNALIQSRSQLYTAYSVKDKNNKYRSVVDIDSVVELLREILKKQKS